MTDMGCKICKPKMIDCLTCKRNEEPTESFCFDKGKCTVPLAMVRDGKIIAWEDDDSAHSRLSTNGNVESKCGKPEEAELNAVAYLEQLGYTCVPPIVTEDFEAEWKRYMASKKDDLSGRAVSVNMKDVARHFAEWQMARDKETIEVAEDHAMLAGRMNMKGEMMKGAVQAEVGYFTKAGLFFLEGSLRRHGLKEGDKVKLIIIKDDDSNKH